MTHFDVIVIGGGPGGATLSTFVAMAGHDVLVLEKERFPRYQIGESLLPATIMDIARLLGIDEKIKKSGYELKRGATFSWGADRDKLWTLNFGRSPPEQVLLAPGTPFAYNVPRASFDTTFLENAREKGVDVRQGHRVVAPILDNGTVTGVEFVDAEGRHREARARYVVDASGHRGFLSGHIGAREFSQFFRRVSVFGYFDNGDRLPFPLEGNVLFQAHGDAWMWYIPLDDRRTSVGAVLPASDATRVRRDPALALDNYISRCMLIQRFLADAKPCDEPPFDEVRIRSEYSYCNTRFWIPGAMVIGDAACFVDVLLSSGVHLATYAALVAARSINSILDGKLGEERSLNEFETRLRLEYAIFYQGLIGLYDMERDGASYTKWLRHILQLSNGVFVEWKEKQQGDPTPGLDRSAPVKDVSAERRSAANLEEIRTYNAEQIRYDGKGHMSPVESLPQPVSGLTRSDDDLYWVER